MKTILLTIIAMFLVTTATFSQNEYPIYSNYVVGLPPTEIEVITRQDLGNVSQDSTQHIVYALKNVGKEPMKILQVKTSSAYVSPEWDKGLIPSGEIGYITLHFMTKGRQGRNVKVATVFGNFNKNEPIMLYFECNVL